METIGLLSGVLLFSVLCLLPEVRAQIWYLTRNDRFDSQLASHQKLSCEWGYTDTDACKMVGKNKDIAIWDELKKFDR